MDKSKTSSYRIILSILGGLLLLLGSIVLSRMSIDFQRLSALGYLGVFLATLFGSATLFFPIPNIATVFAAGVLFNPLGVAIASGLGSTIGETIGYLAGLSGETLGKNSNWRLTLINWINKYGGLTLFLLALIPNPFFDLAGLVSGISHYPLPKFLLATFCGKTIRSFILAYSGSMITL